MNSRLTLVLAATLLINGILAGCDSRSGGDPRGRETLRIAILSNVYVSDYRDNYLTRLLENTHNVNLEFTLLTEQEWQDKIALMAASGELPDIVLGSLPWEQILEYGGGGTFIPLNGYLADTEKTSCFAKIPRADRDAIIRAASAPDGNIYSFVKYEPDFWNMSYHRFYINRAWLEKLNIAPPSTTDELRRVLLAFRDRDPNGNGKKDEIGVMGWYDGGYGEDVIRALINSFIFYNGGSRLSFNVTDVTGGGGDYHCSIRPA